MMVNKIRSSFSKDPLMWYKTIILGSIPVFLTFILGSLLAMQSDIGGMKIGIQDQKIAFQEYKYSFEKYADKTEKRITKIEERQYKTEKSIMTHDFAIKDLKKKVGI